MRITRLSSRDPSRYEEAVCVYHCLDRNETCLVMVLNRLKTVKLLPGCLVLPINYTTQLSAA